MHKQSIQKLMFLMWDHDEIAMAAACCLKSTQLAFTEDGENFHNAEKFRGMRLNVKLDRTRRG